MSQPEGTPSCECCGRLGGPNDHWCHLPGHCCDDPETNPEWIRCFDVVDYGPFNPGQEDGDLLNGGYGITGDHFEPLLNGQRVCWKCSCRTRDDIHRTVAAHNAVIQALKERFSNGRLFLGSEPSKKVALGGAPLVHKVEYDCCQE